MTECLTALTVPWVLFPSVFLPASFRTEPAYKTPAAVLAPIAGALSQLLLLHPTHLSFRKSLPGGALRWNLPDKRSRWLCRKQGLFSWGVCVVRGKWGEWNPDLSRASKPSVRPAQLSSLSRGTGLCFILCSQVLQLLTDVNWVLTFSVMWLRSRLLAYRVSLLKSY